MARELSPEDRDRMILEILEDLREESERRRRFEDAIIQRLLIVSMGIVPRRAGVVSFQSPTGKEKRIIVK